MTSILLVFLSLENVDSNLNMLFIHYEQLTDYTEFSLKPNVLPVYPSACKLDTWSLFLDKSNLKPSPQLSKSNSNCRCTNI